MTCREIIYLHHLTAFDRLILQRLWDLQKQKGFAHCSNVYLEEEVGCSNRQIRNSLKTLISARYIQVSGSGKERKIWVQKAEIISSINRKKFPEKPEKISSVLEKISTKPEKISNDTSIIKEVKSKDGSEGEAAAAAPKKNGHQIYPKDSEQDAGKEPVDVVTQIKQALSRKLELAHSSTKESWTKNYGITEAQALEQIPVFLDWFIANHQEWNELDETEILLRAQKLPAIKVQMRFATSWLANWKRKQRVPITNGSRFTTDNHRVSESNRANFGEASKEFMRRRREQMNGL